MQLSAERHLDAPRERVWAALTDAAVLKHSIPGCDRLAWRDDQGLDATVRAGIGTREVRLTCWITVSDRDPPNGCRLTGKAQDGAGGLAAGSAVVRLLAHGDGGTRLRLDVDASGDGALALAGSPLTSAKAQAFAEAFLARLAVQLAPPPAAAEPSLPAGPPAAHPGLRPLIWVPGLISLVILMLVVFARMGAA